MMMQEPGRAMHREIWDLLPWYLTARLADQERARVEQHLQGCAACRDELAQQRQLHRAINVDTGVEHIPARSLQTLLQRLDAAAPVGARAEVARPATPRRATWRLAAARRMRAGSLAAAAAVAVALMTWTPSLRRVLPASYQTVTTPARPVPQALIRAVFSPAITLSELQRILNDANLMIVSGPSEAGVYSLAATSPRPAGWSLRKLRAQASVRFAEAAVTTPATDPGLSADPGR